jgi:CHAT domain-containing protein/tetratricopeptide (TPR) repeat protein
MDKPRAGLYAEFVQQLMYAESVAKIRQMLEDTPRSARDPGWMSDPEDRWKFDPTSLYDALDAAATRYRQSERPAQLELVQFLRQIINEVIPEEMISRPASPSEKENDLTAEQLVEAALHVDRVSAAYHLLRGHRHLVNLQLYDTVYSKISLIQTSASVIARGYIVLYIIARLLGETGRTIEALLLWAGYCGHQRRYASALRHRQHSMRLTNQPTDQPGRADEAADRGEQQDKRGNTASRIEDFAKMFQGLAMIGDDRWLSDRWVDLAEIYRSRGQYDEALAMTEACLCRPEFKLPKTRIRTMNLQGLLLDDMGHYEEAIAAYERAVASAVDEGVLHFQFEVMTNLAGSFLKRGEEQAALTHFREVQRRIESWGDPLMIASTQNNLGHVLHKLNRLADARAAYTAALSTNRTFQRYRSEAISLFGLGDIADEMGDREAATGFYTEALGLYYRNQDPNILLMYGTRIAKTNPSEEDIRWIRQRIGEAVRSGNLHLELFLTLSLGRLLAKNSPEEAAALYRTGIQHGLAADARINEVVQLQIELAKLLGRTLNGAREAVVLLSDRIAEVNARIDAAALDERRGEIAGEWLHIYGAFIALLMRWSDQLQLPDGKAFELLFDTHEGAKSRTFLATLAGAVVTPPAVIPQELIDREAELRRQERDWQDHEGYLKDIPIARRLDRLHRIHQGLQAIREEIKPIAPAYAHLRSGAPAELSLVQQLLTEQSGPSVAFVSYFCDDDSTTCFVIRSDAQPPQAFRRNLGRSTLQRVAQRLRQTFNGGAYPYYTPIRRDRPQFRDLRFFEELSEPLLAFLPAVEGIDLLCIAPHGPLHLLPLHTLRLPNGEYVSQRFAVTYIPSASALSYTLGYGHKQHSTSERPKVYIAGVAAQDDLHPGFFEGDDAMFDLMRWDVTTDIGPTKATPARVLAQIGAQDVVHLTCHGYFDDFDPLRSGLLLADGQSRPPRERRRIPVLHRKAHLVTAQDFLRSPMNASLVTLRACSTGLQRARNAGDELDGLTRALLYAGSASVIVSLWNVDQQSSRSFLTQFYKYWDEYNYKEKWRAFWRAQQEFLGRTDEPHLCHPYHWAPLVLIGDWR